MDFNNLSRELNDLKTNAGRFSWGKIKKFHAIGEYDIIEYHPWRQRENSNSLLYGQSDENKTEFSCYVGGKSTGNSTTTLDEALALCIAYKLEGLNHRADFYFMKMVKK